MTRGARHSRRSVCAPGQWLLHSIAGLSYEGGSNMTARKCRSNSLRPRLEQLEERCTPSFVPITEFTAGITSGSNPNNIVAGPDGNLWFPEYYSDRIGRITPAGTVTEFSAGISSGPADIAAGPD